MNWHSFLYLAPAALVALLGLLVVSRLVPRLSNASEHRTPLEVVLVILLTVFGLVVIYTNFYLGKSSFAFAVGDVASDTIEQYVPFYLNMADKLRDGTLSAWNWEYELGTSAPAFQEWMFDPFDLIIVGLCVVKGDAYLSLGLVLAQSCKILLSALLFDHLLTRYCETPLARILGSLLYGFCGMMVLNGQHYFLGGAVPIFAATVLAFELYLERPRPLVFLLATFLVALQTGWSAYMAFMMLLGTALYLLVRIPHVHKELSVLGYLKTVLLLFVPVICGVLVSGVLCVPYANYLMNETSRTASSTSLAQRVTEKATSWVHTDWIPAIFSRLVGSSLITTGDGGYVYLVSGTPDISFEGSFLYEFFLMGYSGGVLLLLGQFYHWAFSKECSTKDRVLVLLATAMVLLYCFNEFLPSLFTMMVRLQYRSIFVLALPICAAMAVGFEKRVMAGTINVPILVVTGVATLAILAWSLLHTISGRLVCLYYLVATVAALVLMLFFMGSDRTRNIATATLVAALFSMSVVDGFFCTNNRGLVGGKFFPRSAETIEGHYTEEALAYLRENDDTFYRVEKTYRTWCPLNDSLIQHYPSVSAYNSTADGDVEDFYRQLWNEAISTWAVYSQGFRNDSNRPEILSMLGVKYILADKELDYDWCELVETFDSVRIYRNTQAPSLATVRGKVVSESEADALEDAAARRKLLADAVIVPDEVAAAWEDQATAPEGKAAIPVFYLEDDTHLKGTLEASADSVVCMSVPYTGTWKITVDGTQVDTFRANYGFYGFTVGPGTHRIEAAYRLDAQAAGMVFSGAGLVLTLVATILLAVRKPKKEDTYVQAVGRHARIEA